jgi:pyridoxal biosynthesis lyase PdxS
VVVAESGIKTPDDVERLTVLGVNAMLVGESLLKQKDLESAARTLAAAERKRGICRPKLKSVASPTKKTLPGR